MAETQDYLLKIRIYLELHKNMVLIKNMEKASQLDKSQILAKILIMK